MLKRIGGRIAHFGKSLAKHATKTITRRESAREAISAIKEETGHLARNLNKQEFSGEHKAAIHYLKRGMEEYNQENYAAAERQFRRALAEDPNYVRAYTYLGNALYKRDQSADAIAMWKKAIELEPESKQAQTLQDKIQRAQQLRRPKRS